jgi:sporulation protein YlmC with PRC-barrel domain
MSSIPFTRIELCNDFTILQSNPVLIYLINSSHNITGIMVDASGMRQAQHELGGKLFWDEQEQTIVSFSKKEGFVSVPFYYALNDIGANIIVSPLQDVEEDSSSFESTPPLSFF